MSTLTALPHLPIKLREITGSEPPSYALCYKRALDGRFPTERRHGRYYVKDADLAEVAAVFGLTVLADRIAA